MGRKRKFGEKSAFVSIRVPKSKRKEYRNAVRDFVEKKFATETKFEFESVSEDKESKIKLNTINLNKWKNIADLNNKMKKLDKKKEI
ncbi:MAG: hypothetical protein ACFFD2_23880 [Promethearchaeota archaeon]